MKSPTWSKVLERIVGKNETSNSESTKAKMPEEATKAQAAEKNPSPEVTSIEGEVEDTAKQLPPKPWNFPTPHKDYVHSNPPDEPTYRKYTVFTAGSIEMGKAVNWQPLMAGLLGPLPITVCNPRKGFWDQTITQQAKDAFFKQQVVWELGALEQADVICFFFDVLTKSPVSLLELGLWAASGKVVVCCGDAYWKSGNVHLTCERYGVPYVKTFDELVPKVKEMLELKGMKLDANGDLIGDNAHVTKERPKMKTQLEAEKAELQKQVDELRAQLAATQSKM
jgi:hypothetical protein